MLWSVFVEPGLLVRREIKVAGWPLTPLKIVFISDLHAGSPHINKDYIKNLMEEINAEKPDLILIGGDLVINGVIGGTPIPFAEVAEIIKLGTARLGIYAVLGNHDWWNDATGIRTLLNKSGITVLENESRKINYDGGTFWLAGIGDDYTRHADLKKAVADIGEGVPVIAFMHDPGALTQNLYPFFLTLAGHLHGGQVNFPFHGAIITPSRAPREWAAGFTQLPWGKLFVSKGIGTSRLPIRFNAAPEFVVINLTNQ